MRMGKIFYPDFFNDVFGPIMQPGSSSCFAGTSRVGRVAGYTLKSDPLRVKILFNPGDHHMLDLGNMMDDRGYLGGLQDFAPDDIRLFSAHESARKAGISYEFGELESDNSHPGSVVFELEGRGGDTSSLTARSIGGGMIETYEINGFQIKWQADTFAVLAWGKDETVLRRASLIFNSSETVPVNTEVVHDSEGRKGFFWEFSRDPDRNKLKNIFEDAAEWRLFPALLPVVTTADRKPQLFRSVDEWQKAADERGISFLDAAIEYEKGFSGWDKEKIWDYFENISSILDNQIHSLEKTGYEKAEDTPNLPIYGKLWDKYAKAGRSLEDPLAQHILVHAFSTNAKLPGVKIVPGPMGTGGGYLYSALDAVREAKGYPHRKLVEGLVVAAGIGAIAYTRAHPSGASGCTGESGVCCAMGSAAVTWMAGGDGTAVDHAASMALQANLGLQCDPIPGGREFPCITRTLRAAITMPLYADLALAGMDPLVPYHEVLDAMEENYRKTPGDRLHGPLCGINCSPAARRCCQSLQTDLMGDKLRYEAG
jgi:L-serine dehydratase